MGIFGHLQTGKTTLAEKMGAEYSTLDQALALRSAEDNPEAFILNRKSPFVIDECQLAPPLFPALKEAVRVKKGPGQFLLTGSVRFTSRKAIRESLTGRLYQLELLPMTLEEAQCRPLSDTLVRFLEAKSLKTWQQPAAHPDRLNALLKHFELGGLPGICFHREASIRSGKFGSHLDTLLRRDLRLVVETSLPTSVLQALLVELALGQGMPLEMASLSRKVRVSVKTLPHLIEAFEALFLIRILETQGGVKKPILFFEDSGLARYLTQAKLPESTFATRLAFSHFFPQFHYRPELVTRVFAYRTRGGAEVPLVFSTQNGTLGIIPSWLDSPPASLLASAQSFQKAYPGARVLTLGRWDRRGELAPDVWMDHWDAWVG